jgi:hypothetical protein
MAVRVELMVALPITPSVYPSLNTTRHLKPDEATNYDISEVKELTMRSSLMFKTIRKFAVTISDIVKSPLVPAKLACL